LLKRQDASKGNHQQKIKKGAWVKKQRHVKGGKNRRKMVLPPILWIRNLKRKGGKKRRTCSLGVGPRLKEGTKAETTLRPGAREEKKTDALSLEKGGK